MTYIFLKALNFRVYDMNTSLWLVYSKLKYNQRNDTLVNKA